MAKKLSKKLKKIRADRFSRTRLLVFAGIFAIIGSILLIRSFASGFSAAIEPENGTVTSPAVVGSDANASGGKYVQFGGTVATGSDVTLPATAAFYYPWFPETWVVNGAHVSYTPTLGYYDSSTQSVVDSHIQALNYAKIKVGIASWWGSGTHSENTRIPLLMNRTAALGSPVKWALYYEKEGQADPTVAEIQSDLDYITANYASNPSYAHVGGKPVLFVYNASANDNTCAITDKWNQANTGKNFYIVLKVFTGYKTCANQPSSWHQYGPATAFSDQRPYSYTVSPGFWRADEAAPRLARDPTTFQQNVNAMKASGATWQLITTFNEWGEGTATESATDWSTASGFGTYLDILHNSL